MNVKQAWRIVADRAQSAVVSDDEQLALCDALALLAIKLDLSEEAKVVDGYATALRMVNAAQMEFRGLFAEPTAAPCGAGPDEPEARPLPCATTYEAC